MNINIDKTIEEKKLMPVIVSQEMMDTFGMTGFSDILIFA